MSRVIRMAAGHSRHRPSAAYMARITTLRHYLHGDEHEKERGTFYCRACDLFLGIDHFSGGHPGTPWGDSHEEIHAQDRRAFLAGIRGGDYIPGVYRPEDAPNCVAGPTPPNVAPAQRQAEAP